MDIELQWQDWLAKNDPNKIEDVSEQELRDLIIRDLTEASAMTVEEYTLFQKWAEIKERYPTKIVDTLYGEEAILLNTDQQKIISQVKANIWTPKSIDDYLNLEPVVMYTGSDAEPVTLAAGTEKQNLPEVWNTLRTFTSTQKNNSNIGRNLNHLIIDNVTKKYLGTICLSSDFLDLTPRDKYIGWERGPKTQGRMINYTAVGSTIVPLQPLGYNYVGGKLLALLCLSDEVQAQWKNQYGDVLVGVTTTSLYGKNKLGGLSQYDRLTHWKKMGYSAGSVAYEVTKPTVRLMHKWLAKNHTRRFFEWYGAKNAAGQPYKRDHKNRSNNFAYSRLKIPKELIRSEHQRGIYFSPLYTNTTDFLCGKIKENELVKAFDTSQKALADIWKDKFAAKRIRALVEQDRVSTETLFYDDLITLNWQETKEKFLGDVGR